MTNWIIIADPANRLYLRAQDITDADPYGAAWADYDPATGARMRHMASPGLLPQWDAAAPLIAARLAGAPLTRPHTN